MKAYIEVVSEVIKEDRKYGKKYMVINKYKGPIPNIVEVTGLEHMK